MVWLIVAAHFAFLLYLICGGFLALRWRRSIWVHLVVVLWGIGGVALNFGCPLTDIERLARRRAGMPPLDPAGFIDHYITGVVYRTERAGHAQIAAFAVAAISWIAYSRRR